MRFLLFKNWHGDRLRLYFTMDGYFLGTIGRNGDVYSVWEYIPGSLSNNAFKPGGDFATIEAAVEYMQTLAQRKQDGNHNSN